MRFERTPAGQLVLHDQGKTSLVVPVSAFPLSSPQQGISFVDESGHELAWLDHLDGLPPDQRLLIEDVLADRTLVPRLLNIESVSSWITPCVWSIQTDRGPTEMLLKGEEGIRRLNANTLLITDAHGLSYLVPDVQALSRSSKKILDRFL